ncbi:MAG: hypothetical protein Q8P31_03940 [Bacillota bacterium]|nr:hypothetical protein [Bacillota bacterium]
MLRKYMPLVAVLILFAVIHEGTHAVVALAFDEYQAMQVHPYGLEVIFRTPVDERAGFEWAYISGLSNLITLTIGYILFALRRPLSTIGSTFPRATAYWVTVLFMLADALNLSLGPFIYGGDINGIVRGFGISRPTVQVAFFLVLMLNRELLIHNVLPLYGIKTRHIMFRPLLNVQAPR